MKEFILHPIRIRMIQLLAYHPSMTVTALAESMSDIPRSSIYRHMHILSENKIVNVVKEEKIRGTYERAYALNTDRGQTSEDQAEKDVSGLLLKLFSDFSRYFRSADASPLDDKLFCSTNSLLLSDEEFELFKDEIYGVMKKHINLLPENGRKTRTISIISSPAMLTM